MAKAKCDDFASECRRLFEKYGPMENQSLSLGVEFHFIGIVKLEAPVIHTLLAH